MCSQAASEDACCQYLRHRTQSARPVLQMAQLLQPGGQQGGGARAERDLSEAADVLASLGAGAKHDEGGEGEAALPPAPKRLRSSIVRGSDVKRSAVAAQTSQTDHAGSLGPGYARDRRYRATYSCGKAVC